MAHVCIGRGTQVRYLREKFCEERDSRVLDLRQRLDDFYSSAKDYIAFHEPNTKPEYWAPIKAVVQDRLKQTGQCRILEFGAGRTGFGAYLADLRGKVTFHVEDVTAANALYLTGQADKLHICDVRDIRERYDVIFSTFVWEHVTAPKAVLDHLLGLLTLDGSLFVASPRYDFPCYLSPSIRHLPWITRGTVAIWLLWRRLNVLINRRPDFLIHLDPSFLHRPWFRDADAIHWVSFWDLKFHLPSNFVARRIRIPAKGVRNRVWERYLLLFLEIKRVL